MTFLLGLWLAAAGMTLLALTQPKQRKLMLNLPWSQGRRRGCAVGGTVLLLSSAVQAVAVYGPGVGLVTFAAYACFAAWLVALLLTWRRRVLKKPPQRPVTR
ncbi:MAG: DUF3325 domain-containing protein [Pseudomonadota bacterium]